MFHREIGDISETVSSAIKDGKVTETEKNKISNEIKEVILYNLRIISFLTRATR